MATASVPQNVHEIDTAGELDWEEQIYGECCAWARQQAEAYFTDLEERLHQERPAGWEVEGKRMRRMVTRFGEVTIVRRLYRDAAGAWRFLLDEALGLPAQQVATASVTAAVVALCGEMSFAQAGQQLANLTAGVLSTATVWRLKERVAQAALAAAEAEGKAVYDEGALPSVVGEREVKRLYVEADGVYVRLQGEKNKHMEIKCAIAYEGWERCGGEREDYCLLGKKVYVHGHKQLSFWEGAGLAWCHTWHLPSVEQVVVGGDGARWIAAGTAWFDHSLWQLDGFHLARATRRGLGQEAGEALYQAIRQGDFATAQALWTDTPKRQHKSASPARRWLTHLLPRQEGQDWRESHHNEGENLRGLGAMEGTIAHLIADRMKDKGRSWSRQGALHMAILRQLIVNDELTFWCQRQPHKARPSPQTSARKPKRDTTSWLQTSVPALYGPHANRPWTRTLRKHIH